MPPKPKRSRESPSDSPRRQSRRIAGLPPGLPSPTLQSATTTAESMRTQRELSVQTGVTDLSTEPEPLESWPALADRAKKRIRQYVPASRGQFDDKLIDCLLAFIEWLPSGGRESLARDVLKVRDDDGLFLVFDNLCTCLLLPMKTMSKTSTVTPSPLDNRQANVEIVAGTLPKPAKHEDSFKSTLLRRDGYCCVVTGNMDTGHWLQLGKPQRVFYSETIGAHIIPFAYASYKDLPAPMHKTSQMLEVLYRCFPALRHAGMSVKNINHPSNGITIRQFFHAAFGMFHCALQATDTAHVYKIKTYEVFPPADLQLLPANRLVTLKAAPGAAEISLPNPIFLECHYRVAEILNMSGMSNVIEKKIRDWEEIKGFAGGNLNEDGSTDISDILNFALWQSVAS